MDQQERIDELIAGEAFGKGVELGAVAHLAEEFFGLVGRDAEHADMEPREGRIRPVIRFISVVLPEPLGPTRLVMPGGMDEVHAIDAQHFAVEARDVVEDDRSSGIGSSDHLRAADLAREQIEAEAADGQQGHPAAPGGNIVAVHAEEDGAGAAMHGLFKERSPDGADQVAEVQQVAPLGAHARH